MFTTEDKRKRRSYFRIALAMKILRIDSITLKEATGYYRAYREKEREDRIAQILKQ